jgi:hypothetical protein
LQLYKELADGRMAGYKLLYASGCQIDGIDFKIDRLCVAAIKRPK